VVDDLHKTLTDAGCSLSLQHAWTTPIVASFEVPPLSTWLSCTIEPPAVNLSGSSVTHRKIAAENSCTVIFLFFLLLRDPSYMT
jgi:hypothetical protein